MLTELRKYDNLGTPQYFFELFNSLKNDTSIIWSKRDVEQLFLNKIINGRSVFDGCIVLALKISVIHIDDLDNISLNENFKNAVAILFLVYT